jgi:glycosyltransferase involved in cell wall biosynthesis
MSQSQAEKFFWRKGPSEDIKINDPSKVPPAKDASPAETNDPGKKPALKTGLVVGIPCHNSENTIARTIVALSDLDADIIVCDDGSTDATEEISKRLGCKVIKHPRELGRSDSVTSLFLACKKMQADVLLTLRADCRVNLADLSRLIELARKGEVDIAIGTERSQEAIDTARHEGILADRESVIRAYGKKSLTMISPPGTGSVVIEKEVLEFADQQGLKVREFSISEISSKSPAAKPKAVERPHFESRFMTFAASKHPLVFLGIPALGFFYIAALEAVLVTNFSNFSLNTLASFGMLIASSPLFLVSVALSIGSAILYSQKALGKEIDAIKEENTRL